MVSLKMKKKAQLTLFIIVGVFLVAAIAFIFVFYEPELNIFRAEASSPTEDISDCIEDSIKEYKVAFFESSKHLHDSPLQFRYRSQTMPFLCYSTEYYLPCIPQNPLFIERIRNNMQNVVSRDLSRCLLDLKENYEKKGYSFIHRDFNFSLTFNELDIFYNAEISIEINKGDDTIQIRSREGAIPSVLPKLLRTAETIVNYETTFCEFNHMTWQALNREIVIEKSRAGDQTKIYVLGDRNSEDKIKFAIRTCVLPAGL